MNSQAPRVSANKTPAQEWGRDTWATFADLAETRPEAGLHFQTTELFDRKKDASSVTGQWFQELLSPNLGFKTIFKDFREIPKSQLKTGTDSGIEFTSVCINAAIYLPWLVSQCLKDGVVFKRQVFGHITDAAKGGVHHSGAAVDLIVDCTGLYASKLAGVEDKTVVPARGQIVVARNVAPAMFPVSGTDDSSEEACYIMTRAAGGGTILGGCYQKGSWESQPDPSLAIRIMKRCGGKGVDHLDIIRHGVGLRPVRKGGTRIELEKIDGILTVHNYGAGGAGGCEVPGTQSLADLNVYDV
ncbi:D-amino-acid oxidase [Exophiala aquamarina CBS 119918]|uniref:D-amino-acid oxidase n=1 Tax=Exophiala aquamarina CBS 119918 TaxID=1182545 RepID=A0A072P7U0_9EURO|nr:D-amino-acid oxidase [Exophiala aquamarina CBS 119918]KEF55338.1 D-amino-acid oxidase [Exophiala aquamarina CBS 119918]